MEEKIAPTKMWTNYSLNNARKWLGTWTKWDPMTRKVVECFDCIRNIQLLDNMTKMKHQNIYIFRDGREPQSEGPMNGPWEYIRDRDCDEEGLCHPSTRLKEKKARAFFIENGCGVWTIMEPTLGDIFFQETFCPIGDIRLSTGLFYGKDGKVVRVSAIREDSRSRPSSYWSCDTEIRDSFCPLVQGKFNGTEWILTADLKQTVTTGCEWNQDYWMKETRSKQEGNTVINLPDNIAVSFPIQLYDSSESQQFHTTTFCLYKANEEDPEIREQTIFYTNGKFSYFKLGIYHKVSE